MTTIEILPYHENFPDSINLTEIHSAKFHEGGGEVSAVVNVDRPVGTIHLELFYPVREESYKGY